jgi:carboxypeptidase family protein
MKVSDSIRAARRAGPGLFVVALLSWLVPGELSAQAVSGTILGMVKDTSGAMMPGTTVTLVNTGTGLTRTVVTDTKGEYTAPSLPTGTYSVSSEVSGFKKVSLANVRLGVDQKVRIDLTLELGQMTEAVEIQAETPLVQNSSSDLSATVNEMQIKTLPLNGRNFVSLTRTIPGIMRGLPGANIDGAGSLAWRASASFSANGARARDNNFMLDGVDNNELWLQSVVIFPSVDAIDEFKLQTSTYSAEFGRSLGGVVNLQIKSGTNDFHGSAYEFLRNDALDANDFFNNRAGRAKPALDQHQFGATLGGPIFKDKTFFFTNYQGWRIKQGQTYLITVPSDKMRAGDFSEVNRVIYDPLTGQPFPGNVIPQSRWDPAAAYVMKNYIPPPNTAGSRGSNGQQISNFLNNPNLERQDNQFDVKLNHAVSANNQMFVRYSYEQTHRYLPPANPHGDAGQTFGHGTGDVKAQGISFNDTHTFSPRWLNEFRFGWSYIAITGLPTDYGGNLAQEAGIPGVNLNQSTSALSQMTFQNIRNLGSNGNQPLITNMGTFQFTDNVTHILGRHTFKLGGSVALRKREVLNADTIVGQFVFNNNQTSNCAGQPSSCTLNGNTGFDVASFLLGYVGAKNRNLFDAKTYTETKPEYSLYLQDDFRVSSRLTLNVGLRWDVYPPYVEVNNLQSNFDESTGKFVVASDDAVIGTTKVGRYLQSYSKGDLAPRFGFAWDARGNGKTIVRGGIGKFWNVSGGGTSSSKAQNPPFLQSTALTPSPNSRGVNLTLSSGLPPPPGVDPNRAPAGATRSIFDVNFRDAYTENWNVNVQQQLGKDYMFEVAYVGSRGRQIVLKGDPNQARPVVGVTDANVNRPYAKVSPALRALGQSQSRGTLDYNALQVKFQRRFANNFSFLNAYTFGKTIDLTEDNETGLLNAYDLAYNRGVSSYSVRHTLSSNWIYELPVGRDSKLGGWQLSGILYLRSGLPFTVTQTQGVASTGTGNRPNLVGNPVLSNPTIDKWFDPAAYQIVPDTTGTYGNVGRNTLEGPGQFNIDLSLLKRTKFGKVGSELRIEAFNVLNHPQFANPNGTIGNAAVGTITALIANSAGAFGNTTARQVQLSLKLTF